LIGVDDVALLLVFGAGEVLAKRVDVDHQDLKRGAGGEPAQPVHALRVVDEVLEWQVVGEGAQIKFARLTDVRRRAGCNAHQHQRTRIGLEISLRP
jgi:hypothetical protein